MKTYITLVGKKKNPEAQSAVQEIKNVGPKLGLSQDTTLNISYKLPRNKKTPEVYIFFSLLRYQDQSISNSSPNITSRSSNAISDSCAMSGSPFCSKSTADA